MRRKYGIINRQVKRWERRKRQHLFSIDIDVLTTQPNNSNYTFDAPYTWIEEKGKEKQRGININVIFDFTIPRR